MPVPQPDPTTEAELLALLSPAVTDLCRKHGLSLAGPKADKVARLQALLFPVGGGGGGGGGGGLGHGIGGIYDSRPPYAQMMSATGNNTALVGEIATVFPGATLGEPSVVAGWLFLAIRGVTGTAVDMSTLTTLKVGFTMPDGSLRLNYAAMIKDDANEYVSMLEKLSADLVSVEALPPTCTQLMVENALDALLKYVRANTGSELGKRKGASESVSKSTPSREFTCADVSEVTKNLMQAGYPLNRGNLPILSNVTKAGPYMLAVKNGSGCPLLPYLPQTQPTALRCFVTENGDLVEDQAKHWKMEDGRFVQDDSVVAVKKKDRTASEVAHGHIMYWHVVLVYSHMIPNLCQSYNTRVPGIFLHHYSVIKFCDLMRRVLCGRQPPSAFQLEGLLEPALRVAQEQVNEQVNPFSGDDALEYLITDIEKGLNLQRSMRMNLQLQVSSTEGGSSSELVISKPGPAPLMNCLKCPGKTRHSSRVCLKCAEKAKETAGAVGTGVAPGGGASVEP